MMIRFSSTFKRGFTVESLLPRDAVCLEKAQNSYDSVQLEINLLDL
jgi:hypothetical protein